MIATGKLKFHACYLLSLSAKEHLFLLMLDYGQKLLAFKTAFLNMSRMWCRLYVNACDNVLVQDVHHCKHIFHSLERPHTSISSSRFLLFINI